MKTWSILDKTRRPKILDFLVVLQTRLDFPHLTAEQHNLATSVYRSNQYWLRQTLIQRADLLAKDYADNVLFCKNEQILSDYDEAIELGHTRMGYTKRSNFNLLIGDIEQARADAKRASK